MLGIYALVVVVAVLFGLVWPRFQTRLIRLGARDPQWLYINDEPPGFKAMYRSNVKRDEA